MVGQALTFALIGLGAVSALPTPTEPATVKERQVIIGGPGATFTWGEGGPVATCVADVPGKSQPGCIPTIIGGDMRPPHPKRFSLPQDWNKDIKKTIDNLERELVDLQNKKHKSQDDLDRIDDLHAALRYLAGIKDIQAPPGVGTIFHPGKRDATTIDKRFSLPQDWNKDIKKTIDNLERELVDLQNKKHKSQDDLDRIDDLRAALKFLAGIKDIQAPPGVGTIFHPGKRDLAAVGAYASVCPGVEGVELALEKLMHKDHLSPQEYIIQNQLRSFLLGCGITIVKSPDGTTTILKPSDKRDSSPFIIPAAGKPGYDLAGIQKAYEAILQSVGNSKPSFEAWLALQQLASILKLYGIEVQKSPAGTTTTIIPGKRQVFGIGKSACKKSDLEAYKNGLFALLKAYGPPDKAPQQVQLIEQVLVTALILCGQSVDGWTGPIVPDPTIPGGPIKPDPTIPGAPIKPDPTIPGGEIHPSDKRQFSINDPAALLAALHALESQYGKYGSGTIPAPIFIIMQNIVTILQAIPGVIVPDWPNLGGGSIHPSD